MSKPIQDFVQGDTFEINISYDPIPVGGIVGGIIEVTLTRHPKLAPVLSITHTIADDGNATAGLVILTVTNEMTASIEEGSYYFTLKQTFDGNTHTLLRSGKDNTDTVHCYANLIDRS